MARKTRIIKTTVCSEEYGVTSVVVSGGKKHVTQRKPCQECPWRMDVPTGVFPADAYRTSAPTAYDAAITTFACHMTGSEKPSTCAGFLLRHGENNLSVRLALRGERIDLSKVTDGGLPVYETYRDMAIANGVSSDDPCLREVRGNDEIWSPTGYVKRKEDDDE